MVHVACNGKPIIGSPFPVFFSAGIKNLPMSTAADLGACTSKPAMRLEFCDMPLGKRLKEDDSLAVNDRITNLPNVLLYNILSSLPTKDAVATSVLSRQWRRTFTWLTHLNFEDFPISHCANNPHLIDSFPSFKRFVDNVLQSCQSEQTIAFRLHFAKSNHRCCSEEGEEGCYPKMKPMHVNAWISFPLTRGVRELDICIRVRKPDKLPSAVFGCQTLEVLKLDINLDLEVPSSMCLPNLKELHLTVVHFPEDDSLTRLVSSCPSLEHMALVGSMNPVISVYISSPSLRELLLDIYPPDHLQRSKVVIEAPNLEYFYYVDIFALCYSIGGLSSLVKADIDVVLIFSGHEQLENLITLVSSLSNVQHLFLRQGCVEGLEMYELEYKLPLFRNLKHLQLGCFGHYAWNEFLLKLLNYAPFLQTLDFPEGIVFEIDEKEDAYVTLVKEELQSWSKTQIVPSCLEFHLKKMSIKMYELTKWEMEIAKYFLKNALVLEEFTVVCKTTVSLADRILLDNALQKLPRGSMTCSISVQ